MKILIPVDGSPASVRSVKWAIELVRKGAPGNLVLLNVKNLPMFDLLERGSAMLAECMNDQAERVAQEALQESVAACKAAQVPFTVRIERGAPAPTIGRVAAEEEVDHIVMGRRGLGGVRGLVLGSVSTQVLYLPIEVPITLVK